MTVQPTSSVTVRPADLGDVLAIRGIDGLSASSVALLDHDLAAADRCCLVAERRHAGVAGDAEAVHNGEVVGVAEAVHNGEVVGVAEAAHNGEVVGVAEAAHNGEVVGYAAAIVQIGEAQVIDLVVAPAYWGRGIGGRLLDALLAETAARGAGPVSLEVATDNAAAQALYRQRGFVVEGRRPRYYRDGTDALIMWRHPPGTGGPGGDPSSAPGVDLPASNLAGSEFAATSTSLQPPPPHAAPTLEREDH